MSGYKTVFKDEPGECISLEQEKVPTSTALIQKKLQPVINFVTEAPRNILLASATTPAERLALERMAFVTQNPQLKPPPYWQLIKNLKYNGLTTGIGARTSYCFSGNLATLMGISCFGNDSQGLFATTVLKNAIYPLYLWNVAKLKKYSPEEMKASIIKGMKDPAGHASFFTRNLLASFCLAPGFKVRDITYQALNEENTALPTIAGLVTTLTFSATMNSFLKPLFTDANKYSFLTRWNTAKRMPGLGALVFREMASLSLIFGNTVPEKRKRDEITSSEVLTNSDLIPVK